MPTALLLTMFVTPVAHMCSQEFVRLVKSCKATMADRALALGSLQTARADVAAKRSKLMKLRGTPGIRVGHQISLDLHQTTSLLLVLDADM